MGKRVTSPVSGTQKKFQAEDRVKQEKQAWLQQVTLHAELENLLIDRQINAANTHSELTDQRVGIVL